MSATTFTIKLPQFEGPFDLLLFFIERDELDINNIPIHTITDKFLAYIREMQSMNIDLASEFILVAATLCKIKAKVLIPRKPVDEEGNEIDPREELVQRLLEYKRYKSVLDEMRALEEDRSGRFYRGNAAKELRKIANVALVDAELESLDLYKLLKTFEKMVRKMELDKASNVHTIMRFTYTIQDQQTFIYKHLTKGKKTGFSTIFGVLENRVHAIITFLALLELINQGDVELIQGDGYNNFWVLPIQDAPTTTKQNSDVTLTESE